MGNQIPDILFQTVKNGVELYPALLKTGQPILAYTKVNGIKSIDDLKTAWSKGYTRYVHVPCRSSLLAFDIDVKNGRNGIRALVDYCTKKGFNSVDVLKNAPLTKTPGGGFHLYFKYAGEQVINNEALSGVEVKYSSLITAPGSISHKGQYSLTGSLKDAPNLHSVLQGLLIPRFKKESEKSQRIPGDITLDRIESILYSQGHTPSAGSRNRFAFNFSLFAAKQGKDKEQVTEYLLKYNSPDFPVNEIKNTVKSAYRIKGVI